MIQPITVAIDVPVDPFRAFRCFVDELDAWWPRPYTWSGKVLERIAIEARTGGLCSEFGPHGFRCDWGRVLAIEPGSLLRLSWQIAPSRAPEPNPARASHVHVTFAALPAGGARVTLAHDGFERHGAGAGEYRDAMAAAAGWPWILQQYATRAAGG